MIASRSRGIPIGPPKHRHGGPKNMPPGPHVCPVCGDGSFLHVSGLRSHMSREHPGMSPRERSLALDRLRWPGSVA